jgi:hypothetical protein
MRESSDFYPQVLISASQRKESRCRHVERDGRWRNASATAARTRHGRLAAIFSRGAMALGSQLRTSCRVLFVLRTICRRRRAAVQQIKFGEKSVACCDTMLSWHHRRCRKGRAILSLQTHSRRARTKVEKHGGMVSYVDGGSNSTVHALGTMARVATRLIV